MAFDVAGLEVGGNGLVKDGGGVMGARPWEVEALTDDSLVASFEADDGLRHVEPGETFAATFTVTRGTKAPG